MLTLDLDEITISYPTMFELLYDLKGMGENNCAWNRNLNLSLDSLLAAQTIYRGEFRDSHFNNASLIRFRNVWQ